MSEIEPAIEKNWTERVMGIATAEIFKLRYEGGGTVLEVDREKRLSSAVVKEPELLSTDSFTPFDISQMDGWAASSGETSAK